MNLAIRICLAQSVLQNQRALVATVTFLKTLQSVELTIVAEEAIGFLRLDSDEASDEVVDDGSDEDEEQEDLGL